MNLLLPLLSAALADGHDEEIVITGTRTEKPRGESPVPVEVIDRASIEASGAEDLAELLEDHPGVDLQQTMVGASLRLQGLEPEHVLVMVNGVRLIGRKDGTLDLSRFPVDEIERVEIVKGSASALYGSDAVAGVINIVTRAPTEDFAGNARVRYGTFSTIDATAGLSLKGWRLSGGWHTTDGYDLDPSELSTNGAAGAGFEVAGQGMLDVGSAVDVQLLSNYTRRRPQRVSASATGAVYDIQNLTEELQLTATPVIVPDAVSRLTIGGGLILFRDQYLSDQRGSDALDTYEGSRQQLVQVSTQYDRILSHHQVTVGGEVMLESIASPRLDTDGRRQRYALFAQEDWSMLERLELLPGVRLDHDSQFGQQLSPKVSLRWTPADAVVVRSGYGRGFRAPSFLELLLRFENVGVGYEVTGNLALQPERSHGLTVDVELSPSDAVTAYAGAFINTIDDLITIDLVDEQTGLTTYSYVNIEQAMTRGGEAGLTWKPGPAELSLGYALTDTLDVAAERPLPGRARHRGTVSLQVPIEPRTAEISGRARLVGAQVFYADTNGDDVEESLYTDPYASIDLRTEKQVTAALSALAGVNNLLDAGDAETLPLEPRQLYAGLFGTF